MDALPNFFVVPNGLIPLVKQLRPACFVALILMFSRENGYPADTSGLTANDLQAATNWTGAQIVVILNDLVAAGLIKATSRRNDAPAYTVAWGG